MAIVRIQCVHAVRYVIAGNSAEKVLWVKQDHPGLEIKLNGNFVELHGGLGITRIPLSNIRYIDETVEQPKKSKE